MGECKSNRQQKRFNIKKAKYSHFFDSECHFGESDRIIVKLK
ncbi:unnamed protein product [Meloidogyne enterolobii]|uniref:Uncharacterized protein n=1 Tax=Meloidogyne enterolobii TaxID=390850 RepID=A0ACB0ZD73_MELEN